MMLGCSMACCWSVRFGLEEVWHSTSHKVALACVNPQNHFDLSKDQTSRSECNDRETAPNRMLSIKRPTQTTVLYTVSTRSPAQTLSARLATVLFLLARILTGLLVATSLLWEYRRCSPLQSNPALSRLEKAILTSPSGQIASLLAANLTRPWRLLIYAGITWLIFRKGYTEESLLVIRGLGVQTSTSSPSYLWTSSTRFIPTSTIQDIFIHEAFKGFEVTFYLSIVIEGEEDVVVVFPVSVSNEDSGLRCMHFLTKQ